MLNSVSGVQNYSNVAFKANAMDKVTPEMMSMPGAFSTNPAAPGEITEKQPKKGGLISALAKLVLTAALVAGVAVGARKLIPALKNINVSGELAKDAKFLDKVKYHFANYTDKLIAYVKGIPGKFKKPQAEDVTPLDKVG